MICSIQPAQLGLLLAYKKENDTSRNLPATDKNVDDVLLRRSKTALSKWAQTQRLPAVASFADMVLLRHSGVQA